MPDRLAEARGILQELGMPRQQTNKISGLTLMALARVSDKLPWSKASRASHTIRKGIMDYVGGVLKNPYAENSRESFRRQVLHQFVQGGLCLYNPDNPSLATNSSLNHYKPMHFAPRFAPGSVLLYLGDTSHKALVLDEAAMRIAGIPLNQHDKMPDVVLLDRKRNWLFLVEAVTSHGPMSPKRVFELKEMLKGCSSGLVFVSAFPDISEFKKHAADIAWDTEVWLADVPDHMMHFNGDRFLGPR